MQFDRGFISPYFITDNEKRTVELDNPVIMIMDKPMIFYPNKVYHSQSFLWFLTLFYRHFELIMSTHSAPPCGSCGFEHRNPRFPRFFFTSDPVLLKILSQGAMTCQIHCRCVWMGHFVYIISMENDYDSSWGYYVDIMGILCGYHGAHYFQTKPRIMLLTTFLAGSWVNASNLVAPKTGFLIPSGKHTLWLCQNSYWKWP